MSVVGYTIYPGAVRGVLNNVESDAEDFPAARKNILDDMTEAIGQVRTSAMADSLSTLWNELIALQAEAVETRTAGAIGSMRSVVNAYVQGDESMMDAAEKELLKAPDLNVDDLIAVDQNDD
ncbi:DUF6507 family protein [Arthrobacter sp. AOP36-A1-22]|uniref:DUF6507 family protein n=1 Tax=unclassified Arthrobacter TaxID=235627 RepID=UPI0040333813